MNENFCTRSSVVINLIIWWCTVWLSGWTNAMFATRADTRTSLIASIPDSNISSFTGWTSTFSEIDYDWIMNIPLRKYAKHSKNITIYIWNRFIYLPECLRIDFRFFIVNIGFIWGYRSVVSDVISRVMSWKTISNSTYPSSARTSKHRWIFRNHIVRWDGWIWFIWWRVTRRIGRAMFDVFSGWILSNGSAVQITMAGATPG